MIPLFDTEVYVTIGLITAIGSFLFFFGLLLGICMEGSMWRSKGDHEYMNVKESAGRLYNVRRFKVTTYSPTVYDVEGER